MSSKKIEHSRYHYGICLNDNCNKAKSKELQRIALRKDFLCEECGKPLTEREPALSFSQKYRKILGPVIALIIVGGAISVFLFIRSNKEPNSYESELIPDNNSEVNDSIITDIPIPITESAAETEEKVDHSISNNYQTTKQTENVISNSIHNLGYGTWNGTLKNGEPHGNGTLTYSTNKTIDNRDSKQRVAQPGEYVIGEWDNGHLIQGRWFKNDGTKEAIIIGKAG